MFSTLWSQSIEHVFFDVEICYCSSYQNWRCSGKIAWIVEINILNNSVKSNRVIYCAVCISRRWYLIFCTLSGVKDNIAFEFNNHTKKLMKWFQYTSFEVYDKDVVAAEEKSQSRAMIISSVLFVKKGDRSRVLCLESSSASALTFGISKISQKLVLGTDQNNQRNSYKFTNFRDSSCIKKLKYESVKSGLHI